MRKTKEDALVTKDLVMRAALRVFRRRGYSASTLDEIAQEAGVTRGAVYWHFQGKADLYQAVIQEGFASIVPVFEEVFSLKGTTSEIIGRFIVQYLECVEDNELYQGAIELTLFKSDPAADQADDLANKQKSTQDLVKTLEGFLQRGVEAGEVRAELDIQGTALALIALVNGVIVLWFQSQKAFSLKKTAHTLVETIFIGILADA